MQSFEERIQDAEKHSDVIVDDLNFYSSIGENEVADDASDNEGGADNNLSSDSEDGSESNSSGDENDDVDAIRDVKADSHHQGEIKPNRSNDVINEADVIISEETATLPFKEGIITEPAILKSTNTVGKVVTKATDRKVYKRTTVKCLSDLNDFGLTEVRIHKDAALSGHEKMRRRVSFLSINTLVVLCYASMRYCYCPVFPEDMVEWISNNRIPYFNCISILPSPLAERMESVSSFFRPRKDFNVRSLKRAVPILVKLLGICLPTTYNVPVLARRMVMKLGFPREVMRNVMLILKPWRRDERKREWSIIEQMCESKPDMVLALIAGIYVELHVTLLCCVCECILTHMVSLVL